MNVNSETLTTSTQLQTMPQNHVTINNFQKLQLLEEYTRIQENCEKVSIQDLADWTKENFKLQINNKRIISRKMVPAIYNTLNSRTAHVATQA